MLATLLLASDGLAVMPLVIVAVVVAYVASARLAPTPAPAAPSANTAGPTGKAASRDGSPATAQPVRVQEN
jgi:chloride channel protein, CIC family